MLRRASCFTASNAESHLNDFGRQMLQHRDRCHCSEDASNGRDVKAAMHQSEVRVDTAQTTTLDGTCQS